ncbi:hypothetical protein [Nannocystis radixulma]|uniref:Uncharacterized protein n=1 Tax=Nannocystis radixulma TaxID=2995305 RepID=A0ABT5BEW3_9BACT|nr:hypothetical protein [Nannocystis radixulma]MDC0672679.1 hypothetical protein [Nannocystis radixulma]
MSASERWISGALRLLKNRGFSGHADTELLGAACKQARVCFCPVDNGRLARILAALGHHRHHPRLHAPRSAS